MGCPTGRCRVRLEPHDDGLVLPGVGQWAKRKYHFLQRYLTLFSSGMKNKWSELHYIDLFAGSGFAKLQGSAEVVSGSPVIAANVQDPFTCIHLCEQDSRLANALETRLSHATPPVNYRVVNGDANQCVSHLLADIPRRGALSIAFVDPYGLHFHYETARAIAERRTDLLVLLADRIDASRNWATYYRDNEASSLDKFLGDPSWRDLFNGKSASALVETFRELYMSRLEQFGYRFFDWQRVRNSRDADIYLLLYASPHPTGLQFWRRASQIDEHGQRGLFPD